MMPILVFDSITYWLCII